MEDIDLNISNGTCYFAPGARAADNFIPCGNAAVEGYEKPCCNVGDKCVSSKACFNEQFHITYLVGCTDPEYGAPECPGKGPYSKQQLVGLARCDPDKTKWAGCEDKEGRTKPEERNDNCTCEGQEPLFEGGAKLADIANLPQSLGGSISWFPGQSPTAQPTQATTPPETSSPGSVTSAATSATPTDTPSDTSSPAATLSAGAIAGISVGSAAFLVLLGCLIYLGCLFHRRRRHLREKTQHPHEYVMSPSDAAHSPTTLLQTHDPLIIGGPAPLSHPGLSGFKSELPADVPAKASSHSHGTPDYGRFSMASTLASPHGGSHSPNPSVFGYPSQPQQQHTGEGGPRRTDEVPGTPSGQTRMSPISELQG